MHWHEFHLFLASNNHLTAKDKVRQINFFLMDSFHPTSLEEFPSTHNVVVYKTISVY